MITKEKIKEMADYVFRKREDSIQSPLDKTLYICNDGEILSFRCGTITTGLEGIKNIYESGIGLGIMDINYNGKILNEEERKSLIFQLFLPQK